MKPLEIEILVAEVGLTSSNDQLYHILYDGTVMDEQGFSVLGGEAEAIAERLESAFEADMTFEVALKAAVDALNGDAEGDDRLIAEELEVAVLERTTGRRTFRRISHAELQALVEEPETEAAPTEDSGSSD
jgi:proteasome alpha subunit